LGRIETTEEVMFGTPDDGWDDDEWAKIISSIVDTIKTGFWDTKVLSQQDFDAINSAVLERINQALESAKADKK
jgi:hypothetical protein